MTKITVTNKVSTIELEVSTDAIVKAGWVICPVCEWGFSAEHIQEHVNRRHGTDNLPKLKRD